MHIAILRQSPITSGYTSESNYDTGSRATTNMLLQPPGSEIQNAPSQYEKELHQCILNNQTPVELDHPL